MKKQESIEQKIAAVIDNGNCSGCGGCALVFPEVTMTLSNGRFLRPKITNSDSPARPMRGEIRGESTELFDKICPGVGLTARSGRYNHPIFGRWEAAYTAHATDAVTRKAGSSGGVLTALQQYLLSSGRVERAAAVGSDRGNPTRTVPQLTHDSKDLLRGAGSRYAPVSSLENDKVLERTTVYVGKPCEASSLRNTCAAIPVESPIILSFFCAGTPSQEATEQVLKQLDCKIGDVESIRYRGDGWPGAFSANTQSSTKTMSYSESWGNYLGRDVQWRCKLCVDGTGADADISVGDFWDTDARGYPKFDEAEGVSVAIARTPLGRTILEDAASAGFIEIGPVSLDDVAAVQPLQTDRKRSLLARLAGRRLSGNTVPRYKGYDLVGMQLRSPQTAGRAAARTFVRSIQTRRTVRKKGSRVESEREKRDA